MKNFVMGLIVGLVIMTSGFVFADDGLTKVEAYLRPGLKITMNGVPVTLEHSPVMQDGSTHLQLRDVAKLFGSNVNWNEETQTVELSTTTSTISIQGGKTVSVNDPSAIPSLSPQRFNKTVANLDKPYTKENGDYNLIEIDGNQYVTVVSIPYNATWNRPSLIFQQEGKPDQTITVSQVYQANADGFILDGVAYVKLSVLGLKAAVNGDALQIDKQ